MITRNKVWNTAVFCESKDTFSLKNPKFADPKLLLSNAGLRTNRFNNHTTADPFLFVWEGRLFLFVETKRSFECGKISVYSTLDGNTWENHGLAFDAPKHVSYPFVFENESALFMLMETGAQKELALYRANSFPKGWAACRVLKTGIYCDCSIIQHHGIYYLFANPGLGDQLEIYLADDLDGSWKAHPQNPQVVGLDKARNGGGPIHWNGKLYRFAQNCSASYGEKLALYEIDQLDQQSYSESLVNSDFLPRCDKWNHLGGHHFSLVEFNDKVFYAVDGQGYSHLLNKLAGTYFRLLTKITGHR